ncbi:NTF2-like protein [Fistulina hepatica ATCC 64428]|uniref:NTF2-like protein n=1 Tax=Fistulina hepatica ATCC 64428 TaxID=1128425 RepID=A0A0D7ALT0_9AGAR|nr:NTF2-like protein [Fistulina hepatica ATCC 64428]
MDEALQNVGIERKSKIRDVKMRDATGDHPGGRKGKIRSHRPSPMDMYKDRGPNKSVSSRLSSLASSSEGGLSIRDASRTAARARRGALSAGSKALARLSTNKTSGSVVEHWREFVNSRYNSEAAFLNLENMSEDPIVKKYRLTSPGRGGGSYRDASVIFKLASQLKPEVQTLSLANNSLTGSHISTLNHYLPRLANLSLQDNSFTRFQELDCISSRRDRLMHLRELLLVGNPVKDSSPNYRNDVIRRLPTLEMLDSEPVAKIAFDVTAPSTSAASAMAPAPDATVFPCEMRGSFLDSVDAGMLSSFLSRFFSTFDTDRRSLATVYDPSAAFSVCVNTSIPIRARITGYHHSMPNQRKLDWGPWLGHHSRNLQRMLPTLIVMNSLHVGGPDIVQASLQLPATSHAITGSSDKFCLDAFLVPHGATQALMVVVHGEFIEVDTQGIRSFDRTFILVPSQTGTPSQLANWPVCILSDSLTIRAYSHHSAWQSGPMLVQAIDPTGQSYGPQDLPESQQALIKEVPDLQQPTVIAVCRRTRLNVKYSVDCLVSNGWDIDRAVANFETVKGSLPPDAYM